MFPGVPSLNATMNRRTLQQRLLYHHLPLAVASGACFLLVFALVNSKYLPFRLSMATAYTGALLLGVTLVLGVLKVLRGETSPVSTDWRRDVGIWAALFGLGYVVIGLQVHSPGRMWTYFLYPTEQTRSFPLRIDSFGWANHLGLFAGLLLVLILVQVLLRSRSDPGRLAQTSSHPSPRTSRRSPGPRWRRW